ncbi:MAG: ABC transporter ATP-binding protein [Acutalibacteraceae bacterium]|nr:ABC transporter ATP-binding protein [Acutalibacteraceae bacterium]
MFKLDKVCKSYKTSYSDNLVLSNINTEISSTTVTAITGSSGNGKSTLLNLICGMDKPDSGNIYFNDINLCNLSKNKMADLRLNSFGFVFQDFQLISTLTVKENIQIPERVKYKRNNNQWLDEILEMLDLKEKKNRYPHQLSGGEKQRTAIARAIITKPSVLLADEPTGNLDEENTKRIMRFLFDYSKNNNCGLIFITHEYSLAERADNIIRVENKSVNYIKRKEET